MKKVITLSNIFINRNVLLRKNFLICHNLKSFAEGGGRKTKKENESKNIPNRISLFLVKEKFLAKEKAIEDNTLKIKTIPNPSYFGEALLFQTPDEQKQVEFQELSGVIFLSTITCANYFGLVFPSLYFFPYLCLVTIGSFLKYIITNKSYRNMITEITLINERQVKVTKLTGKSEIVDIKNILVPTHVFDAFPKEDVDTPNNSIPIIINGSPSAISFAKFRRSYKPGEHNYCKGDIDLLLGIVNKKTRKLVLES
jgi:hypothetical protein